MNDSQNFDLSDQMANDDILSGAYLQTNILMIQFGLYMFDMVLGEKFPLKPQISSYIISHMFLNKPQSLDEQGPFVNH